MTKQSLKGTIFKEPDLTKTCDKSFVSNIAIKYQGDAREPRPKSLAIKPISPEIKTKTRKSSGPIELYWQ